MHRIRFGTGVFVWFFLILTFSLSGCGPKERQAEVTVVIDFGPANRPQLEKKVTVPERGTVFEALRAGFPVNTSGR